MSPVGGSTLAFYLGRKFLLNLLGVLLATGVLIVMIDSIENLRRAAGNDIGLDTVVLLAIYRLPSLSELVLPFAVLFAAMLTFLMMTKSFELVVARSVGVSAWQFVGPTLLLALVVGVVATTLYNPLAAAFTERHEALATEAFGDAGLGFGWSGGGGVWLRQDSVDGASVIFARASKADGGRLRRTTIYSYNPDGTFRERIEAAVAILEPGRWRLVNVWVVSAEDEPQHHETYMLSTYLTLAQVQESIATAATVSFWDLPGQIEIAERAGLPAVVYRLQYQTLLARPLLLAAMVLVAASVSLRLFRFGNIGRMILGGIVAGFVLYVVSKLAFDLGKAGAVTPVAAAWGPAVMATLLGMTVLLFQEDG